MMFSRQYFGVLVVKFEQTVFLLLFKKEMKNRKKFMMFWLVVHFVVSPNQFEAFLCLQGLIKYNSQYKVRKQSP
jgi:hypothetical protein